MHFFNKFFCLLGLAVVVAINAREPQDTARLVTVLDKVLEAELSSISDQISKGNFNDPQSQQALDTMGAKFAQVFKHDLTKEDCSVLADFLRDLKNLSATTTADLMLMAESCSTYVRRDALNQALEKYFPGFNKKLASAQDREEEIALIRELEKIDLRDASFNAQKKFMCQCSYLEKYFFDTFQNPFPQEIRHSSLLYKGIDHLCRSIATPFVVFNDFYFFPGWEEQFKQIGDTFVVVNVICNKLLQSIEQQ